MWARKIRLLRNEFSKRSKQTIYTAIVWKLFMHWTIVHMFRLSYCGVRIWLKEYSYVNIRFVNRIHYLRLLFSSSLKLSDFGEFRKIDYIRWRQISFLLFFLHEFCTNCTKFAWIWQNKIHTTFGFENLLKLCGSKISQPKIRNKTRMAWINASNYIIFTAVFT